MTNSLWIASSKGKRFDNLNKDIDTDYLVVGGGITGITTAYLLCKEGANVTLVDANFIGYGASGRNTGKITPQHNLIYNKIKTTHGINAATQYYNANNEALDLIEQIINEHSIDCNFERLPSYLFTAKDSFVDKLRDELKVCNEIGIDCEYVDNVPIPIDSKAAIKFNNTAQFNPKKYIDSLILEVLKLGCTIYENTPMQTLEKGHPCKVKSSNGKIISANKVLICSHVPFYDDLSLYFARLKPERSYVVAGKYNGDFPKATFINVEEPTISLRTYTDNNEKLLLIAGSKHKVGHDINIDHYYGLKEYGNKTFGVDEYKYQWSAQDYITVDHIPYVGFINSGRDNIYVATGYSKWGMSNGTAAAIILKDLVLKNDFTYCETFNPSRKKGQVSLESIKENLDVGYQYIIGKLKFASKDMPEKETGKIVTLHHRKYGAYMDSDEKLHIVDIKCTHLGCELKWNQDEKTWDCPCHGSRFGYDGSVFEGPANIPLNHYGDAEGNEINPNLI